MQILHHIGNPYRAELRVVGKRTRGCEDRWRCMKQDTALLHGVAQLGVDARERHRKRRVDAERVGEVQRVRVAVNLRRRQAAARSGSVAFSVSKSTQRSADANAVWMLTSG